MTDQQAAPSTDRVGAFRTPGHCYEGGYVDHQPGKCPGSIVNCNGLCCSAGRNPAPPTVPTVPTVSTQR